MKMVAELTAYIEGRFPIGGGPGSTGLYYNLAPTGEEYVVIGNQHPDEGIDEETACRAARAAFDAYAEGRVGTLYWRKKPQLEWQRDDPKTGRCVVYIRCLISDAPLSRVKRSKTAA